MNFRGSTGRQGRDYFSKSKPKKTSNNIYDLISGRPIILCFSVIAILIIFYLFLGRNNVSPPSRDEFTSLLTENKQLKQRIDKINKQLQDNTITLKNVNEEINKLNEAVTDLQYKAQQKMLQSNSDLHSHKAGSWNCNFKDKRNIKTDLIEDDCIYDFWKSLMTQPSSQFTTRCVVHKYGQLDGETISHAKKLFNGESDEFVDLQFDRNGGQKVWDLAKLSNSAVNFDMLHKKYSRMNVADSIINEDVDTIYPALRDIGISGFCFIGVPLFDKEQQNAVFYYGSQTGYATGSGDLYKARLKDGSWKIINHKRLWTK